MDGPSVLRRLLGLPKQGAFLKHVRVGVASFSHVISITPFFFSIQRDIRASFHINFSVKFRFSHAEEYPHSIRTVLPFTFGFQSQGILHLVVLSSSSAISVGSVIWLASWKCHVPMMVAWPPSGVDSVFIKVGAFFPIIFRLEKFLLFPLDGVVQIYW